MTTLPFRGWMDRQFRRLPIVDMHTGNISITRTLATLFALVDCYLMIVTKTIGLNNLWLALACLAAAFGKSTYSFLLQRVTRTDTSSENVTANLTGQIIIDRRNREQGMEPA